PSLEELLRSKHEVVAVLTRPDAAAGRGRHVGKSPVAQCAADAGIEVLKPVKPRDPDFLDRLRALAPDCCPVTAYGALIPRAALAVGRQIRACTPAPGAWTMLGDTRLKLWPVRDCAQAPGAPLRPGELLVTRSAVLAGTATHPVELGDVQQGGKRRMPATEWAR